MTIIDDDFFGASQIETVTNTAINAATWFRQKVTKSELFTF